jgi:glutathione-independent formaldehyde dehydrogenase
LPDRQSGGAIRRIRLCRHGTLPRRAPDRLRRAESIGAVAVDFTKGDPVEQFKGLRAKNKSRVQALRPGEEKMAGVNCAIDAVGYQARNQENPDKEDPMQTIRQIAEIVNPTGSVGLIGVYFDEDPGGVDKNAREGEFVLPLGKFWNNGVTIGQGQASSSATVSHVAKLPRPTPTSMNAGLAPARTGPRSC